MIHRLERLEKSGESFFCITTEWFLPKHPTHTILYHAVTSFDLQSPAHRIGEPASQVEGSTTFRVGPDTYTISQKVLHAESRRVPLPPDYQEVCYTFQDGRWVRVR